MNDHDQERRRHSVRDIGIYTTIPGMMAAGPIVGYYLGHLVGKRWGHASAWEAGGAILGLLAAVRQVWLLIRRNEERS